LRGQVQVGYKRCRDIPYTEQRRILGEGKIRLNTPIIPDEGIYCLMVAISLKDDFIKKQIDVLQDELIESEEEEED
jgi:hypothetical protein